MKNIKTIKVGGGADYAKVSDRLKEFRTNNPNGKIETKPIILDDGMVMFTAFILKDKSDINSAEATAHALQTKKGIKDFEKLETVAVGRALALLGYGATGEIASSEEMENFMQFQIEKKEKQTEESTDKLNSSKNLEELGNVWVNLSVEMKEELKELKDKLKKSYDNK